MAVVSPQQIDLTGLEATYSNASGGGDEFIPTQRTFLHIINGSGGSVTATIVTTATVASQAVADVAVAIPAGEERMVGPFQPQYFAAADGRCDITWSATTSVTFAVLRL